MTDLTHDWIAKREQKISWEPTPCTHPGTISVAVVAVATGSDGRVLTRESYGIACRNCRRLLGRNIPLPALDAGVSYRISYGVLVRADASPASVSWVRRILDRLTRKA